MQRTAFKMKLKPGFAKEYQKRHDEIWPELIQILKVAGIHDYSIFLDEETNILFAVQKQSGECSSQALGDSPLVNRWWAFMEDIMETNPDSSPISTPLLEVFRLD
jgi:L-rhamnose mutarotase